MPRPSHISGTLTNGLLESMLKKYRIPISWDRIPAAVDARSQALCGLDYDVVSVMALNSEVGV